MQYYLQRQLENVMNIDRKNSEAPKVVTVSNDSKEKICRIKTALELSAEFKFSRRQPISLSTINS